MRAGEIQVLSLNYVYLTCGHQYSWQANVGQRGVSYWGRGSRRELVERWTDGSIARMKTRVYNGGHKLDASFPIGSGTLPPGPAFFTASRRPAHPSPPF